MQAARLECVSCGTTFPGSEERFACDACGGGIRVVLEMQGLDFGELRARWRDRPFRLWRYRELLPVTGEGVSLEEGGTPLLRIGLLRDVAEDVLVFAKNEGNNPTGSFKDRGMTVGVTRARNLGRTRVICASTGNTAASLAAYAARAGMECIVLVPSGGIAKGKLAQALFNGARVVALRGTFDDAMRIVLDLSERLEAYVLNSINPYRIEGQKTAAFEVFEQLGGIVPDWVVCPVGNGGNLAAYWKGFEELFRLRAIGRLPRLVGVQASGAAPIADAILEGREAIEPVPDPTTVASAIRIGNPANWRKTMHAIRESDGLAIKLPDAAILEAQSLLARREGLFVEPASAASLAGALHLAKAGQFERGERVVCVCTGHGLKDPDAALRAFPEIPPIEPTVEAIAAAVAGGPT
jgi:threonine synthase